MMRVILWAGFYCLLYPVFTSQYSLYVDDDAPNFRPVLIGSSAGQACDFQILMEACFRDRPQGGIEYLGADVHH